MASNGLFTLDVQELRKPSAIHHLQVKWSDSISDVKEKLAARINYPASRMLILRSPNLTTLSQKKTLGEVGIDESGHTLIVSLQFSSNPQHIVEALHGIGTDLPCKELVNQVRGGLNASHCPSKTDLLDCTGGVYFMKSAQGSLAAVFKPQDEEQGMPCNPKGHAGNGREGLRPHFKPGEGYLREFAAYLMDRGSFCQVPPTTLVHCEHPSFHYPITKQTIGTFPKLGSLQKYVRASDSFEDISPSLIGTLELQKIAVLDIRLLNCDRNASNILAIRKQLPHTFNNGVCARRSSRSGSELSWPESADEDCEEIDLLDFLEEDRGARAGRTEDQYELIPIDHGYCFPSKLFIEDLDWTWFHCPHIAKPVDPAIKEYLQSLDIDDLLRGLSEQVGLPEEALFLLKVVHHLLVEGVARGLTLRDIAGLIARTEENKPSHLEKLVANAEENALRALEVRNSSLVSRSVEGVGAGMVSVMKSPGRGKSPVTVTLPSPLNPSGALRRIINSEMSLPKWGEAEGSVELAVAQRALNEAQKDKLRNGSAQKPFPLGKDFFMSELEGGKESPKIRIPPLAGQPISYMRSMDPTFLQSASNKATRLPFQQPPYLSGSWLTTGAGEVWEGGSDHTSPESSSAEGTSPRSLKLMMSRNMETTLPLSSRSSFDVPPSILHPKDLECVQEVDATLFQPLEVRTVESVNFAARGKRERQRSDTTDDELEHIDRNSLASNSSDLSPPDTFFMPRVASFGALQSPPLYDVDSGLGRQLHLLKREKGRGLTKSPEFFYRRMHFAKESVDQLVSNALKAK